MGRYFSEANLRRWRFGKYGPPYRGEPGEETVVVAAGSRQAAKHGRRYGHGRQKSMSSNALQMSKLP
jgi:hypothetical protein